MQNYSGAIDVEEKSVDENRKKKVDSIKKRKTEGEVNNPGFHKI